MTLPPWPCRRFRPAWFAGVLSLGGTIASGANAEPLPSAPVQLSNEARAEQLFHSGEKKFDNGDYAGACSDFSESLKLGPKLGALLNLALCHETVGKPVTAWHEFSHAAVWAAQNNQRERHDFATQHVRALEPKLPRVVLQLPADRAIDGLDLDGEPVPETRWYLPLYLDPGEHRLAVTAPGKQRTTVAFRVTSSPSDQLVYVPKLDDATRAKTPTPRTDTSRRLLGLAGLGIGIAGAALGTTFGVLAATEDEGAPAVKDHATVATVSFASGAVFAAVGGWLFWTSTRGATGTALTATPRREGAAISLTTTF